VKVAEGVIQDEEHVSRQHVRDSEVFFIQEMKRVAKGVLGDQVARESPENVMQRQSLTALAGNVHSGQQFLQVALDDGFKSADAGSGEEATDGISPLTMHVMADGGHD
jgi:hypothetical protein